MKLIDKDAQALLWNKDILFEEGERGTEKVNHRFMRQGTEYNSKQDLGLGLLHWRDHVKAIQVRALLNYADGSRGDGKLVLDQWILSKHAALLMEGEPYSPTTQRNSRRCKEAQPPYHHFGGKL